MEQQNNQQVPQGQQQVQIKITDEVARGSYANQAFITHTPQEFVIDFINVVPSQGHGIVSSRVITNPAHFKALLVAMQENLKKYEEQFGSIAPASDPVSHIGFRTE